MGILLAKNMAPIIGIDNSKFDMNSEVYTEETHVFANLFLF